MGHNHYRLPCNHHHHWLDKVVNLCKANNWIKPTIYQVMKLTM